MNLKHQSMLKRNKGKPDFKLAIVCTHHSHCEAVYIHKYDIHILMGLCN